MTGFNDREKAFESKFALDEKISFDVEARLSKLYGLWAAEQLGLEGTDASTYAGEVVAAAGKGETVVELFAGSGYLTLGLAACFSRVLAVEGDRRSLADLERNLADANRANVEPVAASVERALAQAPVVDADPDVVVLDPPRTGLPDGAVERLAELGAPRIVYLSCDPATLARDAAALCAESHSLTRVRGFDLFPQTPHVEALAVFTRTP